VACLGLIDDASGQRFLIDATPDIASQIDSLNEGRVPADPRRPVDGVLLTHAHIGHYGGLMYLGREALGADRVAVLCTPRMTAFLRHNEPWKQLASLGQIEIREVLPGHEVAMGHFRVTPITEVAGVDVALLDGTFEDAAEIPGRSLAEIPHPLVGESMALLSAPGLRGRVHFIHLNHTNRLLWDVDAVARVETRGFRVARDGDTFPL
jgi:pyrroloquinoline quinone biosynthesis protein B